MSKATTVSKMVLCALLLWLGAGCTRHYTPPMRDGVNVDVPGVHVHVPSRNNTNVHVGSGGVHVDR
jgi:hypothetical protein